MEELSHDFNERLSEIDTYLDFLAALENRVRSGLPRIGTDGPVISALQLRILYSSVYLQLYNLVESTVTKCIGALTFAISKDDRWLPSDLSSELRREWVRHLAKTHADMNYEHRLNSSLFMCEHLIKTLPAGSIDIDKGGGGNWNDEEIFRFAKRLGCTLIISAESYAAVKLPFRDERGALALIVKLRNDLAHGSVSFGECGDGVTVDDLKELKLRTAMYLKEVVYSFKVFIESYSFLQPNSRPMMAQV